jgi:hypothetical protein
MNRDGHTNVKFFIGTEVEHTPANSKRTLFVVGSQKCADIEKIARKNLTPHIFLGANHSFDADSNPYWNETITYLLDRGFMVTLDYQAHQHVTVLKMLNPGIWQSRLFIPLLGVRIPKIETSSTNLTVKIDDIDFNATNPGVWCIHHHELTDSNRFTGWAEYESDDIVSTEEEVKKVSIVEQAVAIPSGVLAEEPKSVDQNPQDIGIDIIPTSALKPDPDDKKINDILEKSHEPEKSAAEVYADGATIDPISQETKKSKGKK